MYFDNLPRDAVDCVQCIETVPSCGICAGDEQCVVTPQTCTTCANATCVPTATSTTATPTQLIARADTKTTELVTLTDSNGTPTATSTLIGETGTTATPAFAYGIIAGGIVILAILGTFLYCTCYKRRARGNLPGYQNFGSDAALPSSSGGNMSEVKA